MLTKDQLEQYHKDGYVIVEELFDEEETALMLEISIADQAIAATAKTLDELDNTQKQTARVVALGDNAGGESTFWVDDELSDDMYSAISQCRRIVDPLEQMLDGEVYHWHHKLMLKDAHTGGAFSISL